MLIIIVTINIYLHQCCIYTYYSTYSSELVDVRHIVNRSCSSVTRRGLHTHSGQSALPQTLHVTYSSNLIYQTDTSRSGDNANRIVRMRL